MHRRIIQELRINYTTRIFVHIYFRSINVCIKVTITYNIIYTYIRCGRKNSPFWEANKNKLMKDTINFYFSIVI